MPARSSRLSRNFVALARRSSHFTGYWRIRPARFSGLITALCRKSSKSIQSFTAIRRSGGVFACYVLVVPDSMPTAEVCSNGTFHLNSHISPAIGFVFSFYAKLGSSVQNAAATLRSARAATRAAVVGGSKLGSFFRFTPNWVRPCKNAIRALKRPPHPARRRHRSRRPPGRRPPQIFEGDPSVFTLSLHGANNFPFPKQRSSCDIEPPDGTGDAARLEALEAARPAVRDFGHADRLLPVRRRYVGDRPPGPSFPLSRGRERTRPPDYRRRFDAEMPAGNYPGGWLFRSRSPHRRGSRRHVPRCRKYAEWKHLAMLFTQFKRWRRFKK